MEGREVPGNESFLEGISNDKNNINRLPQISYCEAYNQGLTQDIWDNKNNTFLIIWS